jgi:hypothetical protein
MRQVIALFAISVCALASAVEAQTVQRPTRPYRGLFGGGPPPDPNRWRQELTLTSSVYVGYEDLLSLSGLAGPSLGHPVQSGSTGTGEASLDYFVGRTTRSLSVTSRAFALTYSDVGDAGPLVGGDARLQAFTNVGRTHRLGVGLSFSYQPTLVLGAFGPLTTSGDVAESVIAEAQTTGFLPSASWSADGNVSLNRDWSARHTTSLEYIYGRMTYLDDVGFDNRRQIGSAYHTWNFNRRSSLQGQYRVTDQQLDDHTPEGTPLTDHNLEMTLAYTRRLSPTRQISFAAGGGASYVDTIDVAERTPLEYWMPSGHGAVGLDWGRSWSVQLDYRRAASVLPGVTVQSFATDTASVQTDGMFGRRIEAAVTAAFSNGRSGGEDAGRFESYTLMAQMRFALARCCALSTHYNYYYYRLMGLINPQPGVPSEYGQNAVRVGFTFWLPLHGSVDATDDRRGRQ